MSKITSPVSILELGSTYIKLAIYDKTILNQSLFYEEKVDFINNEKKLNEDLIFKTIVKAEKDIGLHLNDITLLIDSPCIYSIDLSIRKNYEKKIINSKDIDYLVNEIENLIKINNKEKDILHTIKSKILYDNHNVDDPEKFLEETSIVTIEFKFIMINKEICDPLRNLFTKNHISLDNIMYTSLIKSLGLIDKLNISGLVSFIDIGLNKSSLLIFKDNKLIYLNNINIGSNHVTKDISKVLKIDYRSAEEKKIKFSKNNKSNVIKKNDDLLKKIINSRLEEIIELLFINCHWINNKSANPELKLCFIGNGSKVLNENLLSFGPEFNFISEMSIINEEKRDCCNSALKFKQIYEKVQPQNLKANLENKGFFEKLFDYFSKN